MHALTVLQPRRSPSPATPPRSVRLSLTDRCDLACIYCRPNKQDGYLDEQLDLEAWETMVRGLIGAGVRRVRLTGGEPLLHRDILAVVRLLGTLGLDDVALTTNATRLEKLAVPLREAGLRRVNISLDTLEPARFRTMTRGGKLDGVLRGIDAALAAGFDEIKLNAREGPRAGALPRGAPRSVEEGRLHHRDERHLLQGLRPPPRRERRRAAALPRHQRRPLCCLPRARR